MSTTEPPADNGTPPETPPHAGDEDLVGLDERTRGIVERYIRKATESSGEAATWRNRARETRDELERMQRERETDAERQNRETAERERAAGRADRDDEVAGLRRQVATADIRVRAAGRFADADDAVRMLDLDALLAERDDAKRAGLVDQALEALLKAKPYLAREKERGPLVTQGGRSTAPDGRPRERSWLRG
jgi:hypothetical protein